MNREAVFVTEDKKKIEKIKKKYKNMEMSNDAALKISRLEATNKILKAAATGVGIITVIDFFVPDPVLGLDEIALTSLTGLFSYASKVVDNKIDALAKDEDSSIQIDEVTKLGSQLKITFDNVQKSRNGMVK